GVARGGAGAERVRGDPASDRERTRARRGRVLGARAPGRHAAGLPLRARRQGHAYPAAHVARGRAARRMSPHERITGAIRTAAARGEPALIAYLTAGFPRRADFAAHLEAIAAAADVVEIGVPFTDPMADGVTIQRASLAALAQGVTLRWILDEVARLKSIRTPLLLMSYLNPLLAF